MFKCVDREPNNIARRRLIEGMFADTSRYIHVITSSGLADPNISELTRSKLCYIIIF